MKFSKIILAILAIGIITSFQSSQEKSPLATTEFLNELTNILGKRGGCTAPLDALTLMEAHQILYREFSNNVQDRTLKLNEVRNLLKTSGCIETSTNCNCISIPNSEITYINGGVTLKREIPSYIFALEIMTQKQKKEFLKSLSESNQIDYRNWQNTNEELIKLMREDIIQRQVLPADLRDNNWGKILTEALEENENSIDLEDYQMDKGEINKLFNNKDLLNSIDNQIKSIQREKIKN